MVYFMTSFLGKFPGRKGRECQPGNWYRGGCRSGNDGPLGQEHESRPFVVVIAKLCHYNPTGITPTANRRTQTQPFLCVHDPAWWWVKASNLGTPSGVVVRFNLAHVFPHSKVSNTPWNISSQATVDITGREDCA